MLASSSRVWGGNLRGEPFNHRTAACRRVGMASAVAAAAVTVAVAREVPTFSVKEACQKEAGGVKSLPERYVRPPPHRPAPALPLKPGWHIPVIDLAPLLHPPPHAPAAAACSHTLHLLARACQDWGFFQVINHDVDKGVIDGMWAAYRELFDLPLEVRSKFDAGTGLPLPILKELSKDSGKMRMLSMWKDTMRFRDFDPSLEDALSQAPEFFRGRALAYYKEVTSLSVEILKALSESLGLPREELLKETGNSPLMSTSLHYYSPCPDPSLTIGLVPHKDIDSLTILLQDSVGGLQVMKEDQWVDVEPLPDAFVVNIGEALENISNGRFRSVMHRVINNKEKVRGSISSFFAPAPKARVRPHPQLVSEENPAKYADDLFENHSYNYYAAILKMRAP